MRGPRRERDGLAKGARPNCVSRQLVSGVHSAPVSGGFEATKQSPAFGQTAEGVRGPQLINRRNIYLAGCRILQGTEDGLWAASGKRSQDDAADMT